MPGAAATIRGLAMIPGQSRILGAPAISLNGSAPPCEHLDGLAPVTPQSDECPACRARAGRWAALLVCLTCGWVACSDDSPNQHAKAHYEETDHPLARRLEPGSQWRWCYVHQRLV
jgi:Zn-finger in ubiquitin-hydrolases and other protein